MTRLFDDDEIHIFAFATDKVGYVGGSNGLIYQTGDGGKTWKKLNPPNRSSVGQIDCLSEQAFWIVSGDNDAFVTTDGARSWIKRNPRDGIVRDVSVSVDGDVAVLTSDNVLWTTRKGGRYGWERPFDIAAYREHLLYDGQLWLVVLLQQSLVFLAGYSAGSGLIISTQNAGATWNRVRTNAIANGISSLYFRDMTHGWCASGNYFATTTIGATNDGGLTWERRCDLPFFQHL